MKLSTEMGAFARSSSISMTPMLVVMIALGAVDAAGVAVVADFWGAGAFLSAEGTGSAASATSETSANGTVITASFMASPEGNERRGRACNLCEVGCVKSEPGSTIATGGS